MVTAAETDEIGWIGGTTLRPGYYVVDVDATVAATRDAAAAVAPWLSTAIAPNAYARAVLAVQLMLNGLVLSEPICVEPS